MGQEYEVVECRLAWGEERVYYYDEDGHLERLPARWTDVVGADPVVAVGRGRCQFRVEDLLRLVELIGRVGR